MARVRYISFKSWYNIVGLALLISNLFVNKISQANKVSVEKNTYLRTPGFSTNCFYEWTDPMDPPIYKLLEIINNLQR